MSCIYMIYICNVQIQRNTHHHSERTQIQYPQFHKPRIAYAYFIFVLKVPRTSILAQTGSP